MSFQLRPYQLEAARQTLGDLLTGAKRLANVLPTGAGKTEIMAATAKGFVDEHPTESVLVLSHLSDLTTQTHDRFKLRFPSLSIGILQGKKRPSMMNNIVISTMQTARSPAHITALRATLCKPVGLLMIDETHMLPTTSYDTIQSAFPDVPLVGYTATPFRQRRIMTNLFDKVSFSISLQELIDQGYLVPPELKQIKTDARSPEDVMAEVLHLYRTHELGRQALVYMRNVQDAKTLRCAFEAADIRARAVTGDVSPDARRDIFRSFRKRETQVLCTVDVLTAGFDAPEVEAIFLPYPVKSPTQYVQRIGRGLRSAEDKKSCRVYAFGDAPTCASSLYERLQKTALRAGGREGTMETFRDDLELTHWSKGSEIYDWTTTVCKVVDKMEKLGMTAFAEALNAKQFPEGFLASIKELLRRLPERKTSLPHKDRPATEAQQAILFEAGFAGSLCEKLTKGEASMMISTIFNHRNDPRGDSKAYVVGDGKHKGKHVSELPHAYRKIVKKRYPESDLAALITAWETRQRSA